MVFCHGTPWSSDLWRPIAEALSPNFSVYLWDMPGYGESSKHAEHRVSLDIQGELFSDLLTFWDLRRPHLVAHDYGGAVALRAHLLHGSGFASLTLVDVVALRPWGSDFFRLVRDHADVFAELPSEVHEGALRAYVSGASHRGLTPGALNALTRPWLDDVGQAAFYRQIAQADEAHTDQVEPSYSTIDVPVLVVWGQDDAWIPGGPCPPTATAHSQRPAYRHRASGTPHPARSTRGTHRCADSMAPQHAVMHRSSSSKRRHDAVLTGAV